YLLSRIGHGRRGNEVFNSAKNWPCRRKKYKAKSVPTFKLPLKGVIMRTIVQRGCTMKVVLHHYSALM
ncbi:hypothetical protein, partial [Citrobacter freundii]|uniref:hypothetical protein n=1 Tax=Citrobacter freundii TaxID=546 RepID=UPI0019D2D0E8